MILNLSPVDGVWQFLNQAADGDFWERGAQLQNWEIISAFLLPLVMSVILQSNWSRGLQAIATFLVAVIWVVVKEALGGGLDSVTPENLIPAALKVFALAIAFYIGLWKNTGIPQGIESITNVTPEARRAATAKGY